MTLVLPCWLWGARCLRVQAQVRPGPSQSRMERLLIKIQVSIRVRQRPPWEHRHQVPW